MFWILEWDQIISLSSRPIHNDTDIILEEEVQNKRFVLQVWPEVKELESWQIDDQEYQERKESMDNWVEKWDIFLNKWKYYKLSSTKFVNKVYTKEEDERIVDLWDIDRSMFKTHEHKYVDWKLTFGRKFTDITKE